jgi:hypothetical protein
MAHFAPTSSVAQGKTCRALDLAALLRSAISIDVDWRPEGARQPQNHYATVEEVINNDAAELTVTIHWYIIQGQGRISSYREYEPQRVPRWFYYP